MKREKSFTVLELLVVIAIIGLLSSFVLITVKRAREKARITALLQFSASIKHAFGIDIIGEWEFEDNLDDSSGNNLNGDWNGLGSYVVNDASRQLGKAAQFDGDNYVQIIDSGDNSLLDIDSEITIEAWLKINEFWNKPWVCVVCKDIVYYLRINRKGLAGFSLRDEEGAWHNHNLSEEVFEFKSGKWYHYVGTWNGSQMKIFIDGEEKGDPVYFSGGINKSNKDLIIGKNIISIIDGVRLYNRSFTSAQIKKLYAEGMKKRELLARE